MSAGTRDSTADRATIDPAARRETIRARMSAQIHGPDDHQAVADLAASEV